MTYHFTLYVAGGTVRAERAAASLHTLCAVSLNGNAVVEVVDVIERPDLADEMAILATPVVIRMHPVPQRRVVGDLTDLGRLADALGVVRPPPETSTKESL